MKTFMKTNKRTKVNVSEEESEEIVSGTDYRLYTARHGKAM